jgi:hypothetical protein
MAYNISQDSVITALIVPSTKNFLTCSGTNNDTPKNGTSYSNFIANLTPTLPSTINFRYIFNSTKYNMNDPKPIVKGYSTTSTEPVKIKQFLYNNASIQYICGQFNLSSPSAVNIMYFNPTLQTSPSSNGTFTSLGLTFSPSATPPATATTVNCMAFGSVTTTIYIAGNFTSVTKTGVSNGNIASLTLSGSTWVVNTSIAANATINAAGTIINSMIFFNRILYVAGTDGTNCLFFSYNTISNTWTDLLGSTFTGTINVIKYINFNRQNIIAIGGNFADLGTVTGCNNIVLYTISISGIGVWSDLGVGVDGVGASAAAPWGVAQVFSLEYIPITISNSILWVCGYFRNGGGSEKNSIATVDINTKEWGNVVRADSTDIGLKYFDESDQPGVVYCSSQAPTDASNIIVGGSFRIINSRGGISYNLVKISTATPLSNRTNVYNITTL